MQAACPRHTIIVDAVGRNNVDVNRPHTRSPTKERLLSIFFFFTILIAARRQYGILSWNIALWRGTKEALDVRSDARWTRARSLMAEDAKGWVRV